MKHFSSSKITFAFIFVALGLIALQIPVNVLAGAKVKFTLFDIFAPISGAFLGSPIGASAVVAMQAVNLAIHGFSNIQTDSFLKLVATLRFLPLIAGVIYFSLTSKSYSSSGSEKSKKVSSRFARTIEKLLLLIPIVSILAFAIHPIGRTVWFYSLYWLIPLAVWPLRQKFLLARALGSTFTAHAVGGAVWIWAFNLPAPVWISLIPTVVLERTIFAFGICASYIFVNNLISILSSKIPLLKSAPVNKGYLLNPKPSTLNPQP